MNKESFWAPPEKIHGLLKSGKKVKKLLLFDIDGTLLFTPKVHCRSFVEGFKKVLGLDIEIPWEDYSGRTDSWIIFDIAFKNGVSFDEINKNLDAIISAMKEWYVANVHQEDGFILDGVKDFLKACDERGYLRGLVTGNLTDIAYHKLKHYDLHKGFALGGFGDEHSIRDELILISLKKAQELYGYDEPRENIIYIADTPLDVMAAHKAGIRCVVPYNGMNKIMDWSVEKPDLFIKSMTEYEKIFQLLDTPLE